jgi:hypothetical protein
MSQLKVGPFTVRNLPDIDMTESEIIAQLSAVEEMSEATEYFSDDQLERWLMSEVNRG